MNFYRLKDSRVTDIWTQFDGVATAAGTPGSSGAGARYRFHPDLVPGIGWDALLAPAAGAGDAGSGQCGHLARVPSGS